MMVETQRLDITRVEMIAQLRMLGAPSVFIEMVRAGQMIEICCETPRCYCPRGRGWFDAQMGTSQDWMTSLADHRRLKPDGGTIVASRARLAHVLCKREDYNRCSCVIAMLQEGRSLHEIADSLNAKGIRAGNGADKWSARSVRKSLVS